MPEKRFLELYTQNHQLAIRLTTPSFGRLPAEVLGKYGLTHRKPNYFLLLMLEGHTSHGVDLHKFEVGANELLFILPHQIHQLPASKDSAQYFKLSFDDHCLSLLPRQFSFLVNPFNNQKIRFPPAAATRLESIFGILQELLGVPDTNPEIILPYLNALLAEINAGYFSNAKNPADGKLAQYIRFRLFVEENLTGHLAVSVIAGKLGMSATGLYHVVKHYSGSSPKEFINNRLILEAKRRLYYSESSVKELAYDLGFNDPEYFSRLFKKTTGKTITAFLEDLSGH